MDINYTITKNLIRWFLLYHSRRIRPQVKKCWREVKPWPVNYKWRSGRGLNTTPFEECGADISTRSRDTYKVKKNLVSRYRPSRDKLKNDLTGKWGEDDSDPTFKFKYKIKTRRSDQIRIIIFRENVNLKRRMGEAYK